VATTTATTAAAARKEAAAAVAAAASPDADFEVCSATPWDVTRPFCVTPESVHNSHLRL
jgi:hypothetical protein